MAAQDLTTGSSSGGQASVQLQGVRSSDLGTTNLSGLQGSNTSASSTAFTGNSSRGSNAGSAGAAVMLDATSLLSDSSTPLQASSLGPNSTTPLNSSLLGPTSSTPAPSFTLSQPTSGTPAPISFSIYQPNPTGGNSNGNQGVGGSGSPTSLGNLASDSLSGGSGTSSGSLTIASTTSSPSEAVPFEPQVTLALLLIGGCTWLRQRRRQQQARRSEAGA